MRRKWILILATVAVIALAGAGVTMLTRGPAKKTEAAPAAPQAAIPAGDIHLQGKIRPQQVIHVAPALEGTIGEFFVEVGQEVFEGQLLARITNDGLETGRQAALKDLETMQSRVNTSESDVIRARLEASRAHAEASRARSEFDRLEKLFQRQQMLYQAGATPRLAFEKATREFETAQGEFRTLEEVAAQSETHVAELVKRLDAEKRTLEEKTAQMETAKARSGAAELVSPVQGIVVGRIGEVGQTVAPDRSDFIQIGVNLSQLEVALDPDPPTLRRIKPGQPALVSLPEIGGDGMPGSVKAIQGMQAVVAFTSPNPAVKPGMMAQVRIKAQ